MTQEFLNSLLPPEVESVTVDKYYRMANLFFERLNKYTENEQFIQYLKDQQFGMMILSVHPEMDMLAYILGIPRTVRIYGMLKTGMNMFNGGAPYRTYEANLYSTNVFG